MIKSISYSQEEIIRDILFLYNEGMDIDCDPCVSKGNFYKSGIVKRPRLCFDLEPKDEVTTQGDCRALPIESDSIGSMILDGPFVISTGPSLLNEKKGRNIISSRFSCFKDRHELQNFYWDAMTEAHRVLRKGGLLILKCQDQVSSGKQLMVHCWLYNFANQIHFETEDMFILLSENRINSGKWKRQIHSRKHHCYFFVFIKN